MNYLTILICLGLALTTTAQTTYGNNGRNRVVGNGEVTEENRPVADFDELTFCCNLRVELMQGPTTKVRVEAESNLLPYVKTEVSGNRLRIGFRDNVHFRSREPIVVYVTAPTVTYISGEAAGRLEMRSAFTGERLELEAGSAARISAEFSGAELRLRADSGGRIEVKGSGRTVDATASSGGSVSAHDYLAERGDADASSGGGVEISVSESLEADASSGGRVSYRGQATNVNAHTGSGGSVRKN